MAQDSRGFIGWEYILQVYLACWETSCSAKQSVTGWGSRVATMSALTLDQLTERSTVSKLQLAPRSETERPLSFARRGSPQGMRPANSGAIGRRRPSCATPFKSGMNRADGRFCLRSSSLQLPKLENLTTSSPTSSIRLPQREISPL